MLAQARSARKRIDVFVLHGALTRLVTGLALVGIAEALDHDVGNAKIGVKLVVLLVVTALAWRNRRAESVATWVWATIGLLSVTNVAIAVVW